MVRGTGSSPGALGSPRVLTPIRDAEPHEERALTDRLQGRLQPQNPRRILSRGRMMSRGGSDDEHRPRRGYSQRRGDSYNSSEAEVGARRLNPEVRGLSASMSSLHPHRFDIML
jgi:hypothetical protein